MANRREFGKIVLGGTILGACVAVSRSGRAEVHPSAPGIKLCAQAGPKPTDEELRVQGYRVGKVFATALHEGTEKAFYFIFGDYVERHLQFGLVHADLSEYNL